MTGDEIQSTEYKSPLSGRKDSYYLEIRNEVGVDWDGRQEAGETS